MKKEVISKFNEKPKLKITWWAMWLGLITFLNFQLLWIFSAVIRPFIDKASNESTGRMFGLGLGILSLLLAVSSIVTGIIAFRKGERTWALWLGLIPAIIIGILFVLLIAGEFIFPH